MKRFISILVVLMLVLTMLVSVANADEALYTVSSDYTYVEDGRIYVKKNVTGVNIRRKDDYDVKEGIMRPGDSYELLSVDGNLYVIKLSSYSNKKVAPIISGNNCTVSTKYTYVEAGYVYVNPGVSGVNIRAENNPGVIVGIMRPGQSYKLIKKASGNYVIDKSSSGGKATTSKKSSKTCVVKENSNLRRWIPENLQVANRIAVLKAGTEVTVLSSESGWSEVRVETGSHAGKTGWISSELIS